MGLSQDIRFQYNDKATLEKFIKGFAEQFVLSTKNGLFVVSDQTESFTFEIAIEPFGFRTHRSGEYFYFLGLLTEGISGEFGIVEFADS